MIFAHNPRFAVWLAAGCLLAGPVLAQDLYTLAPGDQIEINYVGAKEALTVRVDVDGQVRLPDIGSIQVAGKTLDSTEDTVEAAIVAAGLFVDPKVTVSITDYAPVLITGDVGMPGSYAYVPNLTVATALGLSGGSRVVGVDRMQVARARSEVDGRLLTLNNDIITAVVRLARLQAQAAGATTFSLPDAARAQIPSPRSETIEKLVADETLLLQNDVARAAELMALWDGEIATLRVQADLLTRRIAVSEELAESFANDLSAAKELQDRGLQTNAAMSRIAQQDAESRSRVLELESARTAIDRSISEASRQRAQFLRAKREETLQGITLQRTTLDGLQLRYTNAQTDAAILSEGNAFGLIESDAFELDFTIVSDRSLTQPVTLETELRPGDALIVRVIRAAEGQGG